MRIRNWIVLALALCLLAGTALAEDWTDGEAVVELEEAFVSEAEIDLEEGTSQGLAESALEGALELRMAGQNGWRKINGKWYYYENGTPAKGWRSVGGKWYYMGSDGVMQTGWLQLGNTYYYLNADGAMREGWLAWGDCWYYFNPGSGALAKGWKKIDGKWYYFYDAEDDRAMVTGWLSIGDRTYYFAPSGAMVEGWRRIDGEWYYFIPGSGAMAENRWCQINGKWYYFDEDGTMATDWRQIGPNMYYFKESGAMAEGWMHLYGTWYYFIPGSGAQAFGWRQIGGKWYYFTPVHDNGDMVTGWQTIDRKTYYFDSSGAMVTGTRTIDGVTYTFSSSGALIWNGSTTPAYLYLDLEGTWEDTYSQRAMLEIEHMDEGDFFCKVHWGGGYAEYREWVFSGHFNVSTGVLTYTDGECWDYAYDEPTLVYTGSRGSLTYSGGALLWKDSKDSSANLCRFRKS